MHWLLLTFAIIASHTDACNLQDPGCKTSFIAGAQLADAFDHLQKHLRGEIFGSRTIRNAGSNIAKYAWQELTVECAQRLGFTASCGIQQMSKSGYPILLFWCTIPGCSSPGKH